MFALNNLGRIDEQTLSVFDDVPEHHIAAWQGPLLSGYFPGDPSRIDTVLEGAQTRVRQQRERVGDAECTVIESQTPDAHTIIWFAPDRGGNILRLVRTREGKALSRFLRAETRRAPVTGSEEQRNGIVRIVQRLDGVRVQRFGSAWVPVGARYVEEASYRSGPAVITVLSIERKNLVLQPDIDREVFEPKIPNGTRVAFGGANGVPHEWRDGRIVPYEDKATTERLRSIAEGRAFSRAAVPSSDRRLLLSAALLLAPFAAAVLLLLAARRVRGGRSAVC